MTVVDLLGCWLLLGLSGLLVDESESWESWTVTQLITLVLWLVPEQTAGNFLSSSSSESLWMVMMLTAGLGVSEMTMGCDWSPASGGALWSTEVAESTEDTGLALLSACRPLDLLPCWALEWEAPELWLWEAA